MPWASPPVPSPATLRAGNVSEITEISSAFPSAWRAFLKVWSWAGDGRGCRGKGGGGWGVSLQRPLTYSPELPGQNQHPQGCDGLWSLPGDPRSGKQGKHPCWKEKSPTYSLRAHLKVMPDILNTERRFLVRREEMAGRSERKG